MSSDSISRASSYERSGGRPVPMSAFAMSPFEYGRRTSGETIGDSGGRRSLIGRSPACERVEGLRGNREAPPAAKTASVGGTWFPPGERRSRLHLLGHCRVREPAARPVESSAED